MSVLITDRAEVKSAEEKPLTKPPLWDHQRRALEFIHARPGTLLHMGMGTGKSRVVVELCDRIPFKKVVILCPVSVISVWPKEYAKYGVRPRRIIALDRGTCRQKAAAVLVATDRPQEQTIVLMNYESAWRDPLNKALLHAGFDLMILDESHRIKSHSGKASKFCAKLGLTAIKRVALTGTPMPHSPLDVFGQLRAISPALLGTSFTMFRAQYAVMHPSFPGKVVRYQQLEKLQAVMVKITFQAGRELLDLPEVMDVERRCHLGPSSRRVYQELLDEAITQINEGIITAANAAVKLLRLRQVTGGSVKTEAGDVVQVGTEKADLLQDVLEDIPTDEPVVVFAAFTAEIDAIHKAGKAVGRRTGEISGRIKQLAEFQAGDIDLVVVQIQAGGVGIDLTRACYCVYYSVGFNLGDYEQSLARTHRPGQTRPVTYIHLLAENTVDEVVYRALAARKNLVEAVLDGLQQYQDGETPGQEADGSHD